MTLQRINNMIDQEYTGALNARFSVVSENIEAAQIETKNHTDSLYDGLEAGTAATAGELAVNEFRLGQLESGTNNAEANVAGLNREVAYLKLKQAAEDRIEGGSVFADDFNGNRFGFELDESRSSNLKIKDGKLAMTNVEATEVAITDSTVINQVYSTAGNGGRKLVRLENGWLVATVHDQISTRKRFMFYVSKDNGATWEQLCIADQGTYPLNHAAIVSYGNKIFAILNMLNTATAKHTIMSAVIDVPNQPNVNIVGTATPNFELSQTEFDGLTLAINAQGTELHAAWSSRNATFWGAYNIRYAKGTINNDGAIVWGVIEQVTGRNTNTQDSTNPTIIINSTGRPIIIYSMQYQLVRNIFDNGAWAEKAIYDIGYKQDRPSAIFVPKEINGLPNGRIWVAWHGRDAINSSYMNVRVSYSDDGGITWAVPQKLTTSETPNERYYPSISVNKNNEVFITYFIYSTASLIKVLKSTNGTTWAQVSEYTGTYPATLYDVSVNFTEPLFIYQNSAKVGFYGDWIALKDVPTTTATAVYNIPSTDYVAAAVAKAGGVSVAAYLNDVPMSAELEGNEHIFEGNLEAEAPATLRLELTRATTENGDNDALVRILGGRN